MARPGLIRCWAAKLRALACVVLLAGGSADEAIRAQAVAGEAAAKAKFTITLARFVQWPPGTLAGDAPLKICLLHNSAVVGDAFALLEGQRVAGHAVNVLPNPRDHSSCGLLFVDGSAAHGSAQAVAAAAGGPSLTLGAVDGFLSQGGMVELANVNDALRFDVNLKAVRSAHLDLSSQVLRLARQVRE